MLAVQVGVMPRDVAKLQKRPRLELISSILSILCVPGDDEQHSAEDLLRRHVDVQNKKVKPDEMNDLGDWLDEMVLDDTDAAERKEYRQVVTAVETRKTQQTRDDWAMVEEAQKQQPKAKAKSKAKAKAKSKAKAKGKARAKAGQGKTKSQGSTPRKRNECAGDAGNFGKRIAKKRQKLAGSAGTEPLPLHDSGTVAEPLTGQQGSALAAGSNEPAVFDLNSPGAQPEPEACPQSEAAPAVPGSDDGGHDIVSPVAPGGERGNMPPAANDDAAAQAMPAQEEIQMIRADSPPLAVPVAESEPPQPEAAGEEAAPAAGVLEQRPAAPAVAQPVPAPAAAPDAAVRRDFARGHRLDLEWTDVRCPICELVAGAFRLDPNPGNRDQATWQLKFRDREGSCAALIRLVCKLCITRHFN